MLRNFDAGLCIMALRVALKTAEHKFLGIVFHRSARYTSRAGRHLNTMALRGDLIRRVTTFLHGYNNIPCPRYLSISLPPGGIFKSDSNKQTRFHQVFPFRQQKGERSGKLVTTFETGKSRPSSVKITERSERGKLVSRDSCSSATMAELVAGKLGSPPAGEGKRPEGGEREEVG